MAINKKLSSLLLSFAAWGAHAQTAPTTVEASHTTGCSTLTHRDCSGKQNRVAATIPTNVTGWDDGVTIGYQESHERLQGKGPITAKLPYGLGTMSTTAGLHSTVDEKRLTVGATVPLYGSWVGTVEADIGQMCIQADATAQAQVQLSPALTKMARYSSSQLNLPAWKGTQKGCQAIYGAAARLTGDYSLSDNWRLHATLEGEYRAQRTRSGLMIGSSYQWGNVRLMGGLGVDRIHHDRMFGQIANAANSVAKQVNNALNQAAHAELDQRGLGVLMQNQNLMPTLSGSDLLRAFGLSDPRGNHGLAQIGVQIKVGQDGQISASYRHSLDRYQPARIGVSYQHAF